MKTFKKNATVEKLLEMAKRNVKLAETDLDFLDMASEELNVAIRLSEEKKGYSVDDVMDEMMSYTNFESLWNNPKTAKYLDEISSLKFKLKHE